MQIIETQTNFFIAFFWPSTFDFLIFSIICLSLSDIIVLECDFLSIGSVNFLAAWISFRSPLLHLILH